MCKNRCGRVIVFPDHNEVSPLWVGLNASRLVDERQVINLVEVDVTRVDQ